jgi:hypothetical protein
VITMREIDTLRNALGVERDTFRNLRDQHLSCNDAIERIKVAEGRVERAIAEWARQGCRNAYVCDICHLPINGALYGAGDGTGFACPECYWQKACLDVEEKLKNVPCVDERHGARDELPERLEKLITATFSVKNMHDPWERSMRVVEEALEFAQANGLTETIVVMLLRRVYSRPEGSKLNEAAGLGVTLLAWCRCHGVVLDDLLLTEMSRIAGMDREKFRAKQREKARAGLGLPLEGEDALP